VFFSGITIAILEGAARETLLGVLVEARRAGKTVAFDPNLRPRLWRDLSEMRDVIMDAAAASDIVLPSFDEEAAHFGDVSPEATIDRYLAAGASTVVVKNGEEAVHYVHQKQSGRGLPEPVTTLVDTTSAGDSFNAGLFAGMGRYASIEEAIKLASGVARQVIGEKGALVKLNLAGVDAL
jgi:2-dehydro-3-deoxygluconokinase